MSVSTYTSYYDKCPNPECISLRPAPSSGPVSARIVRKGSYWRTSDSKRVRRFLCMHCKRSFSSEFDNPCYGQIKRQVNEPLAALLVSKVSQRRVARLLGVNLKTVARKLVFMGSQRALAHVVFLDSLKGKNETLLRHVQFDEMESFVKTKCLPVSIPLLVDATTRKIIAFDVCSMPAKGPLAAFSRRKYGPRADERAETISTLLRTMQPLLHGKAAILTDQNPHYPGWIRKHLPSIPHHATKGRRGHTTGQGELKKGGFDPLFSLNHTAAMLRANINRLGRRTWCTSKRMDRLKAHIQLYIHFHNTVLT